MINETNRKLTLEENIELIRKLFFSKQTSELRLIDLMNIEISNRDGNEDEEKNKELEEIFENLLDYCKSGITVDDLINLYSIDTKKHSEYLKQQLNSHRHKGVSVEGNRLINIINGVRKLPKEIKYFSKLQQNPKLKESLVESLVEKENNMELETDTFLGRITSLMKIAFYANKAEKMRIEKYFGKDKKFNYDKLSEEDLQIIIKYKEILYDIKQECVRQAIIALTTDKDAVYNGSWGIDWDEKRHAYLFRYLDDEQVIPFSFHIPKKCCNTFSKSLMQNIKNGKYSINRIQNKKTQQALIKLCNKQIIEEPTLVLKRADRKIVDSVLEINGSNEKSPNDLNEVEMMSYKVLGKLDSEQREDDINPNLVTQPQEAKERHDKLVRDIIRDNGKIGTQAGDNLDLHAVVAILQNYFDKEHKKLGIKIERITDSKEREKYSRIDCGNLDGCKMNRRSELNADLRRGQRSAVSILGAIGFEVPDMLVKYADTVITDERALDPFDGCTLSREVPIEKLLEYAEDSNNQKYLMESSLNEEQLNKYGLYVVALKRKKEIENSVELISQNSFCILDKNGNKKKVAMVPKFTYNGSNIAYALGYDCYISITPYPRDNSKSTFSITVNPNSQNEKGENLLITESIMNSLSRKIAVYKQDESTGTKKKDKIFILPNKKLASVGGRKHPELYADMSANEIRELFISRLIRDEEQEKLVEQKLREIRIKNNSITGREIFDAAKPAIENVQMLDETQIILQRSINARTNSQEK